jgi:hypothetical protein
MADDDEPAKKRKRDGTEAASKKEKMSCGKGDNISMYVRHAFLFVAI